MAICRGWSAAALVLVCLIMAPSGRAAEEWETVVVDTQGPMGGDGYVGAADVDTVAIAVGDGEAFRLALDTQWDPVLQMHPRAEIGQFLYLVYFQLRALHAGAAHELVPGPPVPVRVSALVTIYSPYDVPVERTGTFRIVHGPELDMANFTAGDEIPGTTGSAGWGATWTLRRSVNFADIEELPPDLAWEIVSVYAESRPFYGGAAVDDVATGVMGPAHHSYDDQRTDRAPDAGYGSRTVVPAPLDPRTGAAEEPAETKDEDTKPRLSGMSFTPIQIGGSVDSVPERITIGIASAGLFVGVVAYGWSRVRLMPFGVYLFSRIARPATLEQVRRRRVFDAIQANAGITFGPLKRLTELGSGSLAHHLKILEQNRLVTRRVVGGRRYYYATDRRAGPVPPADDVLDQVNRFPGVTPSEVSAALGRPRTTVAARLRFWERLGRLSSNRDGRVRRYVMASDGNAID